MVQPSRYHIIARVHGPTGEHDLRSTCAVLLDILPRGGTIHRATSLSNNVFILQEASRATLILCQLALDTGFALRFDLSPDTDVLGEWPAVVHTAPELEQVIWRLVKCARHELLYPLSIWGIALDRELTTNRAIEAFQSLRMDEGLFDNVLARQGFRIAVLQSSITISVHCADLDRSIAWARRALQEPGPFVSWPVDTS